MADHQFIFKTGYWLGEGKITFSASNEVVGFATRWVIADREDNLIKCYQDVEMSGSSDKISNQLVFSEIEANKFKVQLENEMLGKVNGKGVIDHKTIAWEIRDHTGLEGFEVYELQDNGEYTFHAEYASSENFRTLIDGRIWKKST